MKESQGPQTSLRAKRLGENLRKLRKNRKLALRDAGDFLQRDGSTIGRYEGGEFPIRRGDLLALLSLYGVSDERTRENLLQQCEESWRKGWWDQHVHDLGQDFINVPWIESKANQICAYQSTVISGLLQTPTYASNIIAAEAPSSEQQDQIERWVHLRIERQKVLEGPDPAHMTMLVEEWVLNRPMGSDEAKRDQLAHLLKMGTRDNIEIRVVPSALGFHKGDTGSFSLYRMPQGYPDVATATSQGGTLYIEPPAIDRLYETWDGLTSGALSPETSTDKISALVERFT